LHEEAFCTQMPFALSAPFYEETNIFMPEFSFDHSYANLPEAFYSPTQPATVPEPVLIKTNSSLATQLGIDLEFLKSAEAAEFFSGNELSFNAAPIAMAYAGHQFGGWSPQLGDGRALLIGEVIDKNGMRLDVQLKGSGRTPYSRGGDGKAGIGPVLREYILSEAMAALGVPTTRALAAVSTGEMIMRETPLPGAVFTRVAQSHVRVGTFQYFAALDHATPGNDNVKILADYVIERHYPEAKEDMNPYQALLRSVIHRQAQLIAQWMGLGFIHGVMNTDNMQVVGETIDYGPCAFMDTFHPDKKFSSIDRQGRYAWNNQPNMGLWNLARLAEALLPLLDKEESVAIQIAETIVGEFMPTFHQRLLEIFSQKTGLSNSDKMDGFMQSTFVTMAENKTDFTLFFRRLTQVANGGNSEEFLKLFETADNGQKWLDDWSEIFNKDTASNSQRVKGMQEINPIYIPRNHRVEQAIQAGMNDDFSLFHELAQVLSKPFEHQPGFESYELPPLASEEVRRTFCGT